MQMLFKWKGADTLILNNPVYMNHKLTYHASSSVTLIVSIFFISLRREGILRVVKERRRIWWPLLRFLSHIFLVEKLPYTCPCQSVFYNNLTLFLFYLHLINFFPPALHPYHHLGFNSPSIPYSSSLYLSLKISKRRRFQLFLTQQRKKTTVT